LPTPQALAAQALSQAQVAEPDVATWPPSGHGEVNFPTWVHVRSAWAPVSATATAGPMSVTVTATPTETVVSSADSQDGGATFQTIRVTCPGAGAAYDSSRPYSAQHSDCSLTWSWPSAHYGSGSYPLTVSVVYQVAWSGTGGGGALPAITRTTTVAYSVGEIEAIAS